MLKGLKIFGTIVLVLILLGIYGTKIDSKNEARLTDLKETSPQQYLDELREVDQNRWLSELAKIDPEKHVIESTRIDEENRIEAENKRAALLQTECGRKNETTAFVASQSLIKKQLHAPTTAKFPWSSISSKAIGDCKYRVVSHLDSQNGFGAMIRTNYTMVLFHDPALDTWTILDVNVTS